MGAKRDQSVNAHKKMTNNKLVIFFTLLIIILDISSLRTSLGYHSKRDWWLFSEHSFSIFFQLRVHNGFIIRLLYDFFGIFLCYPIISAFSTEFGYFGLSLIYKTPKNLENVSYRFRFFKSLYLLPNTVCRNCVKCVNCVKCRKFRKISDTLRTTFSSS